MKKKAKPQKIQNTAYIVAMRELRRSNAATTHDNRPNRQRTRANAKAVAIREFAWYNKILRLCSSKEEHLSVEQEVAVSESVRVANGV